MHFLYHWLHGNELTPCGAICQVQWQKQNGGLLGRRMCCSVLCMLNLLGHVRPMDLWPIKSEQHPGSSGVCPHLYLWGSVASYRSLIMHGVRPWVQTSVSGNRLLMKKKLVVVMQKTLSSAYLFSLTRSLFIPHCLSICPLSLLRVSSPTRQG